MIIRGKFRDLLFVTFVSVTAIFWSVPAQAGEIVNWNMQSAFNSKLDVVGESIPIFVENLKQISSGTLKVKFFEPGALVPALEIFSVVSKGSVQSGWTTPGFHAATIPAAAFFTSVPFGPAAGEFLAWLEYGGGNAIKNEIYAKHGVKGISCGIIPPEASGWFRREIKTADDLKGLKMRFLGFGALVMGKMGVSTQLIAGADIYPALERGVIDAAELAFPSLNYSMGIYQVAKHYYFPGWHSQSAVGEFLVNLKAYNLLSDTHRTIIDVACDANITWQFTAGEARQFDAMQKIKAKGVTIHFWPEEILGKMRTAWDEVIQEESAKDPLFKRIYENYASFRQKYKVWKDHGYLK